MPRSSIAAQADRALSSYGGRVSIQVGAHSGSVSLTPPMHSIQSMDQTLNNPEAEGPTTRGDKPTEQR
eukprot:1186352-Prorocentrum_minimum.AAC.13